MLPKTKVCTKCGKRKKLEAFNKSSKHSTGRASSCRACYRALWHANRDRYLLVQAAYKALYRFTNPGYR